MALLFTQEDNQRLTQTGPGTPMGQLMRSYWFPAFLSERLPEPHSDPIEIKLLGEELVAFRGADGRVGILGRYCPHRRVSLALARNEDCALRCIYHGWKISADGRVLETPPEPPNSRFAQSIQHTAYVTREAGGMVWTFMGAQDEIPDFPDFAFNTVPSENVWANHFYQPSNWLQGLEGDVDAAHAPYLHFTREEAERQLQSPSKMVKFLFDPRPGTAMESAPWGLQTAFKYTLEDESSAVFWIHPFVMPFFTLFSMNFAGQDGGLMHAWVPVDDESHIVYSVMWSNEEPLDNDLVETFDGLMRFSAVDKANNYLSSDFDSDSHAYVQDRQVMRSGESFSGFDGVNLQDLAVQHSMGPIVDRSKEHLGSEDYLVIQLRHYLLKQMARLEKGEVPPALHAEMDYGAIEYRWAVAPAETPIEVMLSRKDWPAGTEDIPEGWTPDDSVWTSLPV